MHYHLGFLDGMLRLVIYSEHADSKKKVQLGDLTALIANPFFFSTLIVSFVSHCALGILFTTIPIFLQVSRRVFYKPAGNSRVLNPCALRKPIVFVLFRII